LATFKRWFITVLGLILDWSFITLLAAILQGKRVCQVCHGEDRCSTIRALGIQLLQLAAAVSMAVSASWLVTMPVLPWVLLNLVLLRSTSRHQPSHACIECMHASMHRMNAAYILAAAVTSDHCGCSRVPGGYSLHFVLHLVLEYSYRYVPGKCTAVVQVFPSDSDAFRIGRKIRILRPIKF
jgi:hypothetical protein